MIMIIVIEDVKEAEYETENGNNAQTFDHKEYRTGQGKNKALTSNGVPTPRGLRPKNNVTLDQ